MPELILHHYPTSPFSEKVRLVLGAKRLSWKSVIVPMIMPKPDVVSLTGGYRKTPFLQIGSHIYCDTALICDVLERVAPNPSLYPAHGKGLARVLAQWADDKLFWAAMAYNFHPKGAAQMFGGGPPEQWGQMAKVFADDRALMRVGMARLPFADAAAAYKSYLRRLANMLDGQAYLMGDVATLADFAAYHPLWFTRTRTSCNGRASWMRFSDRAWPGWTTYGCHWSWAGSGDVQCGRMPLPTVLPRQTCRAILGSEPFHGRARYCPWQPGQHRQRKLRPGADRRRAACCHPHALHTASSPTNGPARCTCISPRIGYTLKKANP
jgi:glutathione S-transferase